MGASGPVENTGATSLVKRSMAMRLRKSVLILLASVSLSGCAEGIDRAKTYSDKAGSAAFQVPCSAPFGSVIRMPKVKREAAMVFGDVFCPKQ